MKKGVGIVVGVVTTILCGLGVLGVLHLRKELEDFYVYEFGR